MREILFRGKRIDNGEWVFGDLLRGGIDYITAIRTRYGENSYEVVSVDPKTVGQFTGLYDKNGKRIFEGDIIKFFINNSNAEIGKIIFVRGAFQFERVELPNDFDEYEDSERWTFDDDKIVMLEDNCEVIGNIYDNP